MGCKWVKSHTTMPVSYYWIPVDVFCCRLLQHGAMCLKIQQALTLHTKNSTPLLSSPLTAALRQCWPDNGLNPELSANIETTADYWDQLVDAGPLLLCCFTHSSCLAVFHCACWLLIAVPVHMSCCDEWVRPMGYTIISC